MRAHSPAESGVSAAPLHPCCRSHRSRPGERGRRTPRASAANSPAGPRSAARQPFHARHQLRTAAFRAPNPKFASGSEGGITTSSSTSGVSLSAVVSSGLWS
eukprot:4779560-Alexandrium_andersonii.AAC.1